MATFERLALPPRSGRWTRRDALAAAAGVVLLPSALAAETRVLFGSPVELQLPADAPQAARAAVWHDLSALNARWNAWKPGEVTALNADLAAGRAHAVAPALAAMIRSATRLEAASAGFFNPAAGGLVAAWGFHDDTLSPGALPRGRDLACWTDARPSLAHLEWHGDLVRSRHPRVQLDFGAYAKGVAIDRAFTLLARHGVHDAMLNLGGNLATMGRSDGRPWRIGIRDPHGPGLAAMVQTTAREAVVTSGSYERWRLLDGERCTHILDPFTGRPAAQAVSVTVLHPSAALADAAATALLVAGPARWRRVAERMGVDQVLVIDRHGRRETTERMAARLA